MSVKNLILSGPPDEARSFNNVSLDVGFLDVLLILFQNPVSFHQSPVAFDKYVVMS